MDYLARMKVSLTMWYTILDSLPIPRLPVDDARVGRIASLVLRLTCTGPEMIGYWNKMAAYGWVSSVAPTAPPHGLTDEDSRLDARAELCMSR